MTKRKWYSPSKPILASCAVAAAFAASSAAQAEWPSYTEGPSGGLGGRGFYDSVPADPAYIDSIYVRSGAFVDAIQTIWSNGAVSPQHGGGGGNLNTFNPSGKLNYVAGYYGTYVDSIIFCAHLLRPVRVFAPIWR